MKETSNKRKDYEVCVSVSRTNNYIEYGLIRGGKLSGNSKSIHIYKSIHSDAD